MWLIYIGNTYEENDSFTGRRQKFSQIGKLNPTELSLQLICRFKAILGFFLFFFFHPRFLKLRIFLLEQNDCTFRLEG